MEKMMRNGRKQSYSKLEDKLRKRSRMSMFSIALRMFMHPNTTSSLQYLKETNPCEILSFHLNVLRC
jgi:hypothetical protein